MTDVELAARAQAGDERAADELVRRYDHRATVFWTDGFWLPGADRDDLEQEARYGLLTAVRTFRPDGASFSSFAKMCVRGRLRDALKQANSQGRRLLTQAARVADDEGDEIDIIDLLPARHGEPCQTLIDRDELRALIDGIKALAPAERRVLVGICFEGRTYRELGGDSRAAKKRVDNARWRATQRLRQAA